MEQVQTAQQVKPRRARTAKQTCMLVELLNKHGDTKVESDGFRSYTFHPGWTDHRIAAEVGMNWFAVRALRAREFGVTVRKGAFKLPKQPKQRLHRAPVMTDRADLTPRIESLEAKAHAAADYEAKRFAEHDVRLRQIESRIDSLVKALGGL